MPTVLVVEDEPLIREVICEELVLAGFDVVQVANADEAIALLEARFDIHGGRWLPAFSVGRRSAER